MRNFFWLLYLNLRTSYTAHVFRPHLTSQFLWSIWYEKLYSLKNCRRQFTSLKCVLPSRHDSYQIQQAACRKQKQALDRRLQVGRSIYVFEGLLLYKMKLNQTILPQGLKVVYLSYILMSILRCTTAFGPFVNKINLT